MVFVVAADRSDPSNRNKEGYHRKSTTIVDSVIEDHELFREKGRADPARKGQWLEVFLDAGVLCCGR